MNLKRFLRPGAPFCKRAPGRDSKNAQLQSAWKLPCLSTRSNVCAPKKSRCACTRFAGRRLRPIAVVSTRPPMKTPAPARPPSPRRRPRRATPPDTSLAMSREIRIEQQVVQVRVGLVRVRDLLQEARADDAAGAEDLRDRAVLQIPLVLFRRRAQLRKTLRVRNRSCSGTARGARIR